MLTNYTCLQLNHLGSSHFQYMYPANTVGAPLLICVISNSSKVLHYQAVLLWVPLNQKVRNLHVMCMIVRTQDRREMQVWTLNMFQLFHSRPFVTFKTLPGVSKYAVFYYYWCMLSVGQTYYGKKTLKYLVAILHVRCSLFGERETCVASGYKGQRQRTFDNSI